LAALIGAVTIQTVRVTADTFPAFGPGIVNVFYNTFIYECVESVKPKNIGGPERSSQLWENTPHLRLFS
jgi:hypothetical protein